MSEDDQESPTEITIPDSLEDYINDTTEAHEEQIGNIFPGVFSNHMLAPIVDSEHASVWCCADPESSNMHFYIAIVPHAILVYGDLGEMILRPGWNRGIGWLRGALHEGDATVTGFGYLLGKVPLPHRQISFMPGDAIAEVLDSVATQGYALDEMQELLDDWADRIDDGSSIEDSWYAAASNADLDCEWFSGHQDYDSEMYWCAHALRWFVAEWIKLQTKGSTP